MGKIFYTFFIILSLLVLSVQPLWAAVAGSPLFVSLHEGRLTVRAIDVPLRRIVQEITRQMDAMPSSFTPTLTLPHQGGGEKSGISLPPQRGRVMDIRVYGEPQVATEKVTVEFHDLPIDEGLAKILAGYNAVYVYSSGGGGGEDSLPYRLAEVWVFFQGRGGAPGRQVGPEGGTDMVYLSGEGVKGIDPSISPGRMEDADFTFSFAARKTPGDLGSEANGESSGRSLKPGDIQVLISLLNDPDPTVRLSTIETLSGLGSQVTEEDLKDLADAALNNEDPRTRIAILKSTLDLPPEMVIYHALHDPDSQVRIAALWALRWGKDTKNKVMDVVQEAVADPDAVVQARAEEIMKFMLERDRG